MDQLVLTDKIKTRKVKFGFVDIEDASANMILKDYVGNVMQILTPTVLIYGRDRKAPVEYTGNYKMFDLETKISDYCD